ncbi:hypothetical protein EYR38_000092 [Pleurotus pulmonarius]|nr:hypothetical protein EYR38_000092 [Pleurotus pulmonarius]
MSQELQDYYDSKIDAHLAEVRRLREERNANCSKTKSLPSEILVMIFGVLECTFRGTRHSHLQWFVVTHVCRTWRKVALSEPTLWVDFVNPPRKCARELFARTQEAPLILQLVDHPQDNLAFLFDHIVEHPERMKVLTIHTISRPFRANLFTKPAPYLESLDILSETPTEFPPDFLGGFAPQLKSLKCNISHFPDQASWLANLTTLQWSNRSLRPHAHIYVSMDALLSTLGNMPLLQTLDMTFANYEHEVTGSSRTKLVHLPHLTNITIHAQHKSLLKMFSYLSVDNIERLWVRSCLRDGLDTGAVEPVFHFFDRCYHGGDLHYLLHEDGSLKLYRSADTNRAEAPVLTLVYDRLDVACFPGLIPPCAPRVLESRRVASGKLILMKCNTIEELHISTYSRFDLEFDGTSPPYPSLQRLHLNKIRLTEDHLPRLKRWLSGRKSRVELILNGCTIGPEVVKILKGVTSVIQH